MSSGQKACYDDEECAHEARVAGEIREDLTALSQQCNWDLVYRKDEVNKLFTIVLDGSMFKPAALDALRRLRDVVR